MAVSPSLKNSPTWRRDVGNASMVHVRWTLPAAGAAVGAEEDLLKLPLGWEIYSIEAVVRDAAAAGRVDVGIKGGDEAHFFDDMTLALGMRESRSNAAGGTQHLPYMVDAPDRVLQVKVATAAIAEALDIVFYVYFRDRGVR